MTAADHHVWGRMSQRQSRSTTPVNANENEATEHGRKAHAFCLGDLRSWVLYPSLCGSRQPVLAACEPSPTKATNGGQHNARVLAVPTMWLCHS